jgi:hypothetical protein
MTQADLLGLLRSILAILTRANEVRWIPAIEQRIAVLTSIGPATAEYQDAVRNTLQLYGGMGSFQDLVLQNEKGVIPEQSELFRLRNDLFTALQAELR